MDSKDPIISKLETYTKQLDLPDSSEEDFITVLYRHTVKNNRNEPDFLQADLPEIFKALDLSAAGHQIRDSVENVCKVKLNSSASISIENIAKLYVYFSDKEVDKRSKEDLSSRLSKAENLVIIKKSVEECTEDIDTQHTYSIPEREAFTKFINENFVADTDLKNRLPIIQNSDSDLFEKCSDGLILCKMLQKIDSELVNSRALNQNPQNHFQQLENINLALNSATSIGCITTNQDVTGILKKTPYLVMGLLWQIIRKGLFSDIDLKKSPEIFDKLRALLNPDESLSALQALTPEKLLLRWVNYQLSLNKNYSGKLVTNFSTDIKDSTVYQNLLQQLGSYEGLVLTPNLSEQCLHKRAIHTLKLAEKLDCNAFVTPKDIEAGNSKLNTAFVANLFNKKLCLNKLDEDIEDESEIYIETAEEKRYRFFINSLGIDPVINHIYEDLKNGLHLLKLEDKIKPKIVDWKNRVNFPPYKTPLQAGENCVYALEIAENDIKIRLGGVIRGHDINMGEPKVLVLGVIWQLMRAYTISLLEKLSESKSTIEDKHILAWTNRILQSSGLKITGFKDQGFKTGKIIRQVLSYLSPDLVIESEKESENELDDASYLLSLARKIGMVVYCQPEDFVNLNGKMILSFMIAAMIKEQEQELALKVMTKPKIPPKPKILPKV